MSVSPIDDQLIHQMVMMIFGSNMIEGVGGNLSETVHLCQKVFLCEDLSEIVPGSRENCKHLETYDKDKIRGRLEVINHAMAFMHMVTAVVHDWNLSENLIKETHTILCRGITAETEQSETVHSSAYAGKYCNRPVYAGNARFVTPSRIAQEMQWFIGEIDDYLLHAENSQKIGPFFIAARACEDLININPFLGGNGRICCIIINTIILKNTTASA